MMYVPTGHFEANRAMHDAIAEVLASGRISYGDKSQTFEMEFSSRHGRKYGVLSNSGTSSLQVALQAMKEAYKWSDGDEVIIPATTFVATANIVLHNKMVPVLVDVDPKTYNIDVSQIEPAITSKTRVIMPVNLLGQPADLREIKEISRTYGLRVIEDSCESMFSTHYGRPVGSWSDIGCFSLYMAHVITAGVGGIAITDDPDLAARMRSLVNHGLEIEQLNTDENMSPLPMKGRQFRFVSIGHSYRITEFEAALALVQLRDEKNIVSKRKRAAAHCEAMIGAVNDNEFGHYGQDIIATYVIKPGNIVTQMMYPIVLAHHPDGGLVQKHHLTAYLNANGIETRDLLPLVNQPVYRHNPANYPVSRWLIESGFYIGCHPWITPTHISYVGSVLSSFFDEFGYDKLPVIMPDEYATT